MKESGKSIYEIRHDFEKATLNESDVDPNPGIQFEKWMHQAHEAKVEEALAMTLSTADKTGKPSGRILYLREYSDNNFAFFTNYKSKKAEDLLENPFASMTFFWKELERQVRIEGKVEFHSKEASDKYFHARPHYSKIGAWSSPQSKVIKGRGELEKLVSDFDIKYKTEDVPRPEYWGGYILKATYYEFWQGRKNRLHDRITYTLQTDNTWKIERLAP